MADAPDFIVALTDWIGGRAELSRESPFALVAHAMEEVKPPQGEKNFADPYTVIRAWGGEPQGNDPTRSMSLQAYTVGGTVAECMARAEKVYQALLNKHEPADADNIGKTPANNVAIGDDWCLLGIGSLQQPGLIGRDEQDRPEVVFNFDIVYRAA